MSDVLHLFTKLKKLNKKYNDNLPTPSLMLQDEYSKEVANFLSLLKTTSIMHLVKEEKNIPDFINTLYIWFNELLSKLNINEVITEDQLNSIKNNFRAINHNIPEEIKTIEDKNLLVTKFEALQNWLITNFNQDSPEEAAVIDILWKSYLESQKELLKTPLVLPELESELKTFSYKELADDAKRIGAGLYRLFELLLENINAEIYSKSDGKDKLCNRYEPSENLDRDQSNLNEYQKVAFATTGNPYARLR